jgi:hypothetical protein
MSLRVPDPQPPKEVENGRGRHHVNAVIPMGELQKVYCASRRHDGVPLYKLNFRMISLRENEESAWVRECVVTPKTSPDLEGVSAAGELLATSLPSASGHASRHSSTAEWASAA